MGSCNKLIVKRFLKAFWSIQQKFTKRISEFLGKYDPPKFNLSLASAKFNELLMFTKEGK